MGHVIRVENFPATFSKKILIKLPVKFKKLIKEYLVQETEILNQLLGKWEKS